MTTELGAAKFQGAWIRIHDAGDFFSDDYLAAWLRICQARPEVNFYCYTKEVLRFWQLVEPQPPGNLLWVYSYGGTQDRLLRTERDRVADVFTGDAAIAAAGWSSQEASDLLAVLGPRPVGIPANRIPTFLRRLNGRRFSEWQAEVDAERATRQVRRQLPRPRPAADDIRQPPSRRGVVRRTASGPTSSCQRGEAGRCQRPCSCAEATTRSCNGTARRCARGATGEAGRGLRDPRSSSVLAPTSPGRGRRHRARSDRGP
jgi:Gene product 88